MICNGRLLNSLTDVCRLDGDSDSIHLRSLVETHRRELMFDVLASRFFVFSESVTGESSARSSARVPAHMWCHLLWSTLQARTRGKISQKQLVARQLVISVCREVCLWCHQNLSFNQMTPVCCYDIIIFLTFLLKSFKLSVVFKIFLLTPINTKLEILGVLERRHFDDLFNVAVHCLV